MTIVLFAWILKVWSVFPDGKTVRDIGSDCETLASASIAQWCPIAGLGQQPQMLLARCVLTTSCCLSVFLMSVSVQWPF